jgi:hypothetical protein
MVLKTVGKGLQKNNLRFGRHASLHVFNILKPLPFEDSFHLRREKNTIFESGIVLTSLDEVLA